MRELGQAPDYMDRPISCFLLSPVKSIIVFWALIIFQVYGHRFGMEDILGVVGD
ncbi:MAG: hypothetical protein A4E43_01113 [Methanosaeta sp. PtaB.Bin005]|nr:MAG: hypothetical protein A4E43_01113 [Methanosaeta sp. PtaB.Bin005]